MGYGLRANDRVPYRSLGPVTEEEYLSRQDRYEKQMTELGFKIEGLSIEEKMAMLKAHRIDQYEKLTDAVYKRRGWNANGVPTIEKLKEMKMDLPELIEIVERHL